LFPKTLPRHLRRKKEAAQNVVVPHLLFGLQTIWH
jgi:hypothetical protein